MYIQLSPKAFVVKTSRRCTRFGWMIFRQSSMSDIHLVLISRKPSSNTQSLSFTYHMWQIHGVPLTFCTDKCKPALNSTLLYVGLNNTLLAQKMSHFGNLMWWCRNWWCMILQCDTIILSYTINNTKNVTIRKNGKALSNSKTSFHIFWGDKVSGISRSNFWGPHVILYWCPCSPLSSMRSDNMTCEYVQTWWILTMNSTQTIRQSILGVDCLVDRCCVAECVWLVQWVCWQWLQRVEFTVVIHFLRHTSLHTYTLKILLVNRRH